MEKLKKFFSYKKFQGPSFRILFLFNGYLLQKESVQTLQSMGHRIEIFDLNQNPKQRLQCLLNSCLELKPDAVMSINHIGFDSKGSLAALLSDLAIPVIIWYVDHFRFIIQENTHLINEKTAIFTYEKNHVQGLQRFGFPYCFHLPLATSFAGGKNPGRSKYSYLANSVTFVGNTFAGTREQWSKPGYSALLAELNLDHEFTRSQKDIFTLISEQKEKFSSIDDFYHYAGFVAAHATLVYRRHFLQQVHAEDLHIFGDSKWKSYKIKARIHDPVPHDANIAAIFGCSGINLNLSSQQLETAVNQRVFDVPAAGGFLLTDWKDDLADLFNPEQDLVTFETPDELNEKIAFFQANPARKEKYIANARKRIAEEHMLRHRFAKMLSISQQLFSG